MPFARWLLVGLLAAALLINYVDRGALPIAAHLIQDDLGFTAGELGLLFSAFSWSYAVLQIPIGWVADRYGAQRVLAAGLAIWACATMGVGLAHSFAALVALRVMLGIGESAGFPCISKILATVVPIRSLGTANGVVAFGYLVGPAIGTIFSGLIMLHFGWRAVFWIFGAVSLLWLLPWSRVSLPQREALASAGDDPPLPVLLRQSSLWGTSLGLFSSNYTFYFMLNWLPFYLVRERGFSTGEMASLTSGAYLLNAVSALLAGVIIDRAVRRGQANLAYKSCMVLAHVGSVACMLCIGLGSLHWAIAGIFVFQILLGLSSPGAFGMSQILAGPAATARWVGIQNAIGNLAGVIAPMLTGFIVEETHHFQAAFLVAAVVSILGVAGWVWMIPRLAPIPWSALRGAAEA